MTATKRKYLNNLKNLKEENINLRIELETTKKQLVSIRDMMNGMLGESYYIIIKRDHPQALEIGEAIKNIVETSKLEKDKEAKPQKCHNCQKVGHYDRGFCFECSKPIKQVKPTEQEEQAEFNPPKEKMTDELLPYKCAKCEVEGDDKASFKVHGGRMYCLDCLSNDFNVKKGDNK